MTFISQSLWVHRVPRWPTTADLGRRGWVVLRQALTPVGLTGVVLGLWGCLAIFNATVHLSQPLLFVGRQLIWLVLAIMALVVASLLPSRIWGRVLPAMTVSAYVLLWLVLWLGVRINGMRGWFAWHGIFVQPSEFAKPVFALALAYVMMRTAGRRTEFWRGFVPALLLFGLWAVPLALEPDFGALLVYGLTFIAVVWTMGARTRHLLYAGLGLLPCAIGIVLSKPYVLHRLLGFLQPERYAQSHGWHIAQFQRTLASGGLFGQSWGHGIWTQSHLPLGYSDSIFASLAESIGCLGVLPLILLVLVWVAYGLQKVTVDGDRFRATAILGMVVFLAVQSLIHLSVNLGLLPTTGITLPLISYGGSSLVSSLAMIGMVESLARDGRGGAAASETAGKAAQAC